MYVVIAGAGHMGLHIAKTLVDEGHSVAIVEPDKKVLDDIEAMDVLMVHGNAASPKSLTEAGIISADMLVAVTGSDEANIIACVIGKSKGCKTIARLQSPDFIQETAASGKLDIFGMDLVVSPYIVTSNYISRTLLLPSMIESGELSQGKTLIVEIKIDEGNPSIGRMLGSITLPRGAVVCAVSREERIVEPEKAGPMRKKDRAVVVLDSGHLVKDVETAFAVPAGHGKTVGGRLENGFDKVVIVGATETGIRVAGLLDNEKAVIIIDKDEEKCQHASEILENTMVINGDATNSALFEEEGIGDASVFVATSDDTDFNMLSCLLAKKRGVAKTLAIVDEPELRQLFEQVGVDIAISPRMMAVDFILKHISGKEVSATLTTMQSSGIIVMEVPVTETLWMVGKEYGNIKFPRGAFIGSVIRAGAPLRPTKFDIITPGDRIIMMVQQDNLWKVEKIFSHHIKSGRFW